MHVSTAAEIGFAVAAVLAGAALIAAIVGRVSERVLVAIAWLLAIVAVALWVAFAFERSGGVAVSAVGGTLAAVVGLVATRVPRTARLFGGCLSFQLFFIGDGWRRLAEHGIDESVVFRSHGRRALKADRFAAGCNARVARAAFRMGALRVRQMRD